MDEDETHIPNSAQAYIQAADGSWVLVGRIKSIMPPITDDAHETALTPAELQRLYDASPDEE